MINLNQHLPSHRREIVPEGIVSCAFLEGGDLPQPTLGTLVFVDPYRRTILPQ